MRGLFVPAMAVLLCGCPPRGPGDDTDDPVRNGLRVVLEADAAEEVTLLMVTVDEVVFEAEGPNGSLSVGTASSQSGDLLRESLSTVLDLEAGSYRDVVLAVELRGDPALELQAEVEGRLVTLRVTEPVRLEAEASCLLLTDGPDQEVVFSFEPSGWLDQIDSEELEPAEGPVLIGPLDNPDFYTDVLDAIAETEATLDDASQNDCD